MKRRERKNVKRNENQEKEFKTFQIKQKDLI